MFFFVFFCEESLKPRFLMELLQPLMVSQPILVAKDRFFLQMVNGTYLLLCRELVGGVSILSFSVIYLDLRPADEGAT